MVDIFDITSIFQKIPIFKIDLGIMFPEKYK